MWQHRQEERDLKRAENDIRRNQRELKRSLKHYELGQLTVRHPSFIHCVRIWSMCVFISLALFFDPGVVDYVNVLMVMCIHILRCFDPLLLCYSSLPCCAIPHSLAVLFLTCRSGEASER